MWLFKQASMESENSKLELEIKNASKKLKDLTRRIKESKAENSKLNMKLEQWCVMNGLFEGVF